MPWVDTMAIEGQSELPKGVGHPMSVAKPVEVTAKDGVKLESAFLGA